MVRRRKQKAQAHYYLLINSRAANHNRDVVTRLATAIREQGGYYTTYESESPADLIDKARLTCGLKRRHRPLPRYLQQRGKVTAVVACGGDGTVNLAAGVALQANLPLGILPLGRFNNIARALYGSSDIEEAIQKTVNRGYRRIDTATVADRLVIASFSAGLIPELARLLEEKRTPKFGFRWSQLGAKAAQSVRMRKTVIKIDAFRFDLRPTMVSINLLPYTIGLPLSPASVCDDHQLETIFDVGGSANELSSFVRLIYKKRYSYGTGVRLFRGSTVTFQPVKRQTVYLDGELTTLPTDVAEVQVSEKQLKVFC
jgi:diacylglycerol kinase (ATP)